jgi:hypothetical protein
VTTLSDRNFWLKYVRTAESQAEIGIEFLETQKFRLSGYATSTVVRSMLTIYELGLLYALAKDAWTGAGVIVDAGPLLGATTFALARGLRENQAVADLRKRYQIYSFDLFIADRALGNFVGEISKVAVTPSLLHEFIRINGEHLSYIVPHQGDFVNWTWPKAPIEILFMDLAKSWELNDHYVRHMLPYLLPDLGILVQQDYVHYYEYWIHLTMEYLAEYFELCDVIYGATAFYRLTKPIPPEVCQFDLRGLPFGKKLELLERAREKMSPSVQEVMKCAAAKCAIDHGKLDDAETLLQGVTVTRYSSDPISDFSGIAHSNKKVVGNLLDAARRSERRATVTVST